MNFIAGSLLYHCHEEIAFWLFVTLIEDLELRDVYEPQLPGLYKHCFIISRLVSEYLPDIHSHFLEHNILTEMYAGDWIFCLFMNVIPLDISHQFLDMFFKEGWLFFYKFALSILSVFKHKLLEEDEF